MNDFKIIQHCPFCNKDLNSLEVHSMNDTGIHWLCNYCNNIVDFIYKTDCSIIVDTHKGVSK